MTAKTCNCCHARYTRAEFAALPFVGTMEELTLRNCPCGSTLALPDAPRSVESVPPCELYAGPLTMRGVL